MSAPLLLVARPEVWVDDRPDDIPELLEDIKDVEPEALVLDLPRGMASPRCMPYLNHQIVDKIRALGYHAEWRPEFRVDGAKRVIVVAQRMDRGRRIEWASDFGHLILANQ